MKVFNFQPTYILERQTHPADRTMESSLTWWQTHRSTKRKLPPPYLGRKWINIRKDLYYWLL